MSHLLKSWQYPDAGSKKFISSTLMYHLFKSIDNQHFEVVTESFIDIADINSEQPDLIIYDRFNHFHPALILECVSNAEEADILHTISLLCRIYHIEEGFIYNMERSQWKKVGQNSSVHEETSYSSLLHLDMDTILRKGLSRYKYSI